MIKVAGIQFTDEEVEIVKTAASLDESELMAWLGDHKAELIGAGLGGVLGTQSGLANGPKDHLLVSALLGGAGGAGLGYGAGAGVHALLPHIADILKQLEDRRTVEVPAGTASVTLDIGGRKYNVSAQ